MTDAHDAQLTFEQALKELEQIVSQLERGELPLAESLVHYERGVARLSHCYHLLAEAEARVSQLEANGLGGWQEKPFMTGNERDGGEGSGVRS
jgi:exodeoxyribonuclease VII small subunit